MINEPEYDVSASMVDDGVLEDLAPETLDEFLGRDGLQLLFFTGGNSVRRESHDVAVALRELLADYGDRLQAARMAGDQAPALLQRFRVPATPCLVFSAGSEVLEVLPRVRDWADYAGAFQRYLGPSRAVPSTGAAR